MGLFSSWFGKKKQEPTAPPQPATPPRSTAPQPDSPRRPETPQPPATPPPPEAMEKVAVLPGIELSKPLAACWPQIAATKRTSIKITATPVDDPHCRKNSFGCYPTLPKGFDYPKDEKGNYMYPLAQIHCADLPPLAGYPDSGYLQFYIAVEDNDIYGLDFDDKVIQKNFRVLYFGENEVPMTRSCGAMSEWPTFSSTPTACERRTSPPFSTPGIVARKRAERSSGI